MSSETSPIFKSSQISYLAQIPPSCRSIRAF
jgi:hypothetical protein